MAEPNVSREEDIISIANILAYLIYDGFNQYISVALVLKRMWDIQHYYPMRDHALSFLRSCMVVRWRNTDTKPFAAQSKLCKILPHQVRM